MSHCIKMKLNKWKPPLLVQNTCNVYALQNDGGLLGDKTINVYNLSVYRLSLHKYKSTLFVFIASVFYCFFFFFYQFSAVGILYISRALQFNLCICKRQKQVVCRLWIVSQYSYIRSHKRCVEPRSTELKGKKRYFNIKKKN